MSTYWEQLEKQTTVLLEVLDYEHQELVTELNLMADLMDNVAYDEECREAFLSVGVTSNNRIKKVKQQIIVQTELLQVYKMQVKLEIMDDTLH